jgi:phospholipase C
LLTADEIAQANAAPHLSPHMPKQEKGIKPSCPLPYQLYADGKLSADKKSFEIKFKAGNDIFGKSAAGSPFSVYAPGKYTDGQVTDTVRTWAYTALAGDTLTDNWPLQAFDNSGYHLRVYGPNGFYREFKGNAADPEIDIACEYQRSLTDSKKLTGNIELKLHNLTSQAHTIEIADHAYKANNHTKVIAKGGTLHLPLSLVNSYGWYDFSVKVNGIHTFEKRYAGRVETGRPSYSDPQMGNI